MLCRCTSDVALRPESRHESCPGPRPQRCPDAAIVGGKQRERIRLPPRCIDPLRRRKAGAGPRSLSEEALQRLNQTTYDLLLCDYKPGDGMALRLLHEVRKDGPGAPVIFLSDHVDQIAVDAAIKAGASDCLQTSNLNESSIARAIRYAIAVYCKERQRQKAEDTVRKLWRAVEQSADLVIITDRGGVIEYVNPAFEALTGYSDQESG